MEQNNKKVEIKSEWISFIIDEIINNRRRKEIDTKLILSVYNSKEDKLFYLKERKLELKKHIFYIEDILKNSVDQYLEYLSENRNDKSVRKKVVMFFIDYWIIGNSSEYRTVKDIFIEYQLFRRDKIINKYIEITSVLEFSFFLDDQINKINKENLEQVDSDTNNYKLNWKGTPTELIELVKALKENGSIEGTQKEIINGFSNFLNIDLKESKSIIQRLRNRYDKTIFLEKLKTSLIEYYLKKDEEDAKKKYNNFR